MSGVFKILFITLWATLIIFTAGQNSSIAMKKGVSDFYKDIEEVGRIAIRPVMYVVDHCFTPNRPDVAEGSGPAPVKITITNNTNFVLEFEGYEIDYGKIIKSQEAPQIIGANKTVEFTASGRQGALYGPKGKVRYKEKNNSFRINFSWNNPIATGSKVDGGTEILDNQINLPKKVKKESVKGMYGVSSLIFIYGDVDGNESEKGNRTSRPISYEFNPPRFYDGPIFPTDGNKGNILEL